MNIKKIFILLFVLNISLFDYKIAKFFQESILHYFPNSSYSISISFFWLIIAFIPLLFMNFDEFGLKANYKKMLSNKNKLIAYSSLVVLGLILFVSLGITKYFHFVKYPFIFFIITPIVEEIIFRGCIYGIVGKFKKLNPILISSILFGLHHLQYFNFSLTKFAIFQVTYTFILGLLFGKTRKLSGSIYIGLLLHIFINFVTVYF
jgi:membrane protease YdiL (CAAX protease family)